MRIGVIFQRTHWEKVIGTSSSLFNHIWSCSKSEYVKRFSFKFSAKKKRQTAASPKAVKNFYTNVLLLHQILLYSFDYRAKEELKSNKVHCGKNHSARRLPFAGNAKLDRPFFSLMKAFPFNLNPVHRQPLLFVGDCATASRGFNWKPTGSRESPLFPNS